MKNNKEEFLNRVKYIDQLGDQVDRDASKFKGWQSTVLTFLKIYSPVFDSQIKQIEKINTLNGMSSWHIQRIHEQLNSVIVLVEIDAVSLETTCNDYIERIEKIFKKFRIVAMQLKQRHKKRRTLEINDEYDVQDLLHALLKIDFDDIRAEEWTPSYAGGSVRMDFLLKDVDVVIEVKMTRSSMTAKTLGEELIIDIEKYQNHPYCKKLFCFVYDPEMRIGNPIGLKNDLESKHEEFLHVVITS